MPRIRYTVESSRAFRFNNPLCKDVLKVTNSSHNNWIMRHYFSSILKILFKISIWRTLYVNLHYFPFKIARKLPIFIYKRSEFRLMRGIVIIDAPITTGMIQFGAQGLGTQDKFYSRTIWEVAGTLIIKGKTNIGRGCKISIGTDGILRLGNNFTITGDTTIICQKEIVFGADCLLSWDILIMDTDFHQIVDESGSIMNSNKSIKIGDHVWIGCRNLILKGVKISNNSIICANSTITSSFNEDNCIIGGQGKDLRIIKRGISWKR